LRVLGERLRGVRRLGVHAGGDRRDVGNGGDGAVAERRDGVGPGGVFAAGGLGPADARESGRDEDRDGREQDRD
jgi:hypothetical protein